MRFVLNANVGGLGRAGDKVNADPMIWRPYIDAGVLSEVDEYGERLIFLTAGDKPVETVESVQTFAVDNPEV